MRLRRSVPTTVAQGVTTMASAAKALSFPSIWVATYRSADEWHADVEHRDAALAVFDDIDDRMMRSRHGFDIRGWCAVCRGVRLMAVAWHLGNVDGRGSVNPAWTLNACCHECGLVSRMRALVDFLVTSAAPVETAYVAERVTECFPVLDRLFPGIAGSEFLGDDHVGGSEYMQESGVSVRHEDMTTLSFDTGQFDLVITQDVFEHIPDYRKAFAECRRVLRRNGRLVFTVPFFANLDITEVRATVDADGSVHHLLPAEIHGNPVGDGSLCFQHFGWDMLDALRDAGFADAAAHMYWGPWAGHMGYPCFVVAAQRSG